MAIDATVGAVAKYFSRVRLSQTYEDLRKTTRNILEHMPVIGKSVEEAIERIKKSIRMALPASQMFESLNIPYFGPVMATMSARLYNCSRLWDSWSIRRFCTFIQAKGKGFKPADSRPSKFHSTGPFKINGDTIESAASSGTSEAASFTECLWRTPDKLAAKGRQDCCHNLGDVRRHGAGGFSQKIQRQVL